MTLRPVPARWFEVLTIGADAPRALEALAQTGAVELEVEAGAERRLLLPDTDDLLEAFRELARTHGGHWPTAAPLAHRPDHPRRLLERAWSRLTAWRAEADPLIRRIETLSHEIADLDLLDAALREIRTDCPDLARLAASGPHLAARLFVLPPRARPRDPPPGVILETWATPTAVHVLAVGRQAAVSEFEARIPGLQGRVVPLPRWLPSEPAQAAVVTAERLAALADERRGAEADIAALSARHDIAGALGDFTLIDWLGRHAGDLAGSERLAWITGWTSDDDGDGLRAALDRREVRCLLRLLPEPPGTDAPLVLRNPPWARAFEVFAGMIGTPTRNEADPSLLLAVVAPLMFGFMFGDIGQGLVLLVVGLIYGKRMPVLKLLVPGGVAAVAFGFLFGSVFCREDLIPALWIHPLGEPLTLLAVALAGGVVLLGIGLLLDAVQALWRGDGRIWAFRQAGFVVCYLALLSAIVWRPALWAAGVGAVWYVAGAVLLSHRDRRVEAGIAVAEFVEQTAQLLVNTISFARVGAFALAHAGLSAAIVGVAEVFGGLGFWVTLVLGNLLVLTLEGLVVGIQTTRLVLFEFFIRFLRGGGRPFEPLDPPRIDWAVVAEKH